MLSNEDFLANLEKISKDTQEAGSLWVTFKQFEEIRPEGKFRAKLGKKGFEEMRLKKNQEGHQFSLLVRAKTNKGKFSTVVPPENANYFQRLLHNCLLIQGLNRRKKR